MEILERGSPPEDRVYIASCMHCKTKVKFTHAEAHKASDQRDGDYVWVKCPVCTNQITHHDQSGPYR